MSVLAGPEIHPTAIISPGALLGDRVEIGPFSIVGDRVEIGDGTRVGPGMVIQGPCRIGRNNRFHGQSSIGTDPQDLKYSGEETLLEIGDENVVREFVTVNRGTHGGGGCTRIGNSNFLMTGVHVAHDCQVGSHNIFANAATLAGHVLVEDHATVGAFCGVHQYCRVGVYSFIGGYSVITRDSLPFVKTVGIRNQARTYGINSIGLERKGFSPERLEPLKRAYRTLFLRRMRVSQAIETIRSSGQLTEDVSELLRFIESSERGFIR